MSAVERQIDVWEPPATYRQHAESVEHLADQLVDLLDASEHLIYDPAHFEFLARRLQRAARIVNRALPPEVI